MEEQEKDMNNVFVDYYNYISLLLALINIIKILHVTSMNTCSISSKWKRFPKDIRPAILRTWLASRPRSSLCPDYIFKRCHRAARLTSRQHGARHTRGFGRCSRKLPEKTICSPSYPLRIWKRARGGFKRDFLIWFLGLRESRGAEFVVLKWRTQLEGSGSRFW